MMHAVLVHLHWMATLVVLIVGASAFVFAGALLTCCAARDVFREHDWRDKAAALFHCVLGLASFLLGNVALVGVFL